MEKIKAFIAQNKKLVCILAGAAALLVIAAIVLTLVLGGGSEAGIPGCAVTVKTEGGMVLKDIGVYIYEDADKKEMVSYGKTDENGTVAFAETIPAGSVVVLENVPAGYTVAENYPVTGADIQIILPSELLKEMSPITLGGIMFDFTVTDSDGTEHTLSELLKEKKAVVLNLWYTNCGPCKAEFPFLQQAYDKYSSEIALLALNPVAEDDAAAVSAFKASNALTFPMAKVDAAWAEQIEGIAYPTTIVIDRYGMVSLIHVGGIDKAKIFEDTFAHFAAEDYVQATVADITTLVTEEEETAQGTMENPFELGGETEFEVTVEAGQTVYYNLYRVSGMELAVQSPTLKITCGETEYAPADGKVVFTLPTTDPMTPVLLAFTNTGTVSETYKVALTAPAGAMENPLELNLGDFTAELAEGATQGLYYTYTAAEEGEFVLTVKKAPKGVEYGIALNNLSTSKYLTLEENGEKDADGNKILKLAVNKKDEIQLIVTVLPNDDNVYPAASIKLNAAIVKEEEPTQGATDGGSNTGSNGGTNTGSNGGSNSGPNYNGTLVNPDAPEEQFGLNTFTVEVGAGEKKLVNLIRVSNEGTLCIYDPSAYVVMNGKTYKPNNSGNVFVSIKSEGSFTPVVLEIGNSGSADKTYTVKFSFPKGSFENPIKMEVGENTVNAKANNDQGTYYTFKASKNGTLTLKIKSISPDNVIVGISINDMQSIPTEAVLEEGSDTVSIELKAGVDARIVFSTKDPNKDWKIPKAEIVIEATYQ